MKIAYVITRADAVGGASIHVRDLAAAMRERGHDATVLLGGEGAVTKQLTAAAVPFVSLKHLQRAINPSRDLRAFTEISAALRRLKPDLVSTHTAKAGLLGRAACSRLGIPAVYTPHGWSIGNRISPLAGPLFALPERLAALWCAAIVCVSESEKTLALEKRIAPAEKLRVVHNGMPDIPAALRAKPSRESPRIAMVARFEAPKDHATLLEALRLVQDLEWELDLIGDGPLLGKTQQMAETLGIASRVHFLGYRNNPAEVLARSQVFVLSSRSEAFPRSILEAMRAGLPVVAADVGGVKEAVIHGQTGLLFASANAAALAEALQAVLKSAVKRQLFGAAGRQLYEAEFGFERMVEETLMVYATVLNSTGIGQRNV